MIEIRKYDKQELAEFLGVSVSYVEKKVRTREFPATRFGRGWKFTDDDLKRILEILNRPDLKTLDRAAKSSAAGANKARRTPAKKGR